MKCAVLVTGCNGGIGRALVSAFAQAGNPVIGAGREEGSELSDLAGYVQVDLGLAATNPQVMSDFVAQVRAICDDVPISCLINNAAIQHVGRLDKLTPWQIIQSFHVNVAAPLLLAQAFLSELEVNNGVILNIGSVHAQSTKPEFAAYATSKTALHGATRALAVDIGPKVRVVTLAPAAVATDMLMAGFEEKGEAFSQLEDCHPAGRIGSPDEIAEIAVFLASPNAGFITGATIFADGGVLSRLYDPV